MDTIFKGDLTSRRGRANAWLDSLAVDHGLLRLAWTNFAVVSPGRLYRSNHPTPGRLASHARRHGIRTVINLRGACGNGSDALSREAATRLGMDFFDVPLRSRAAPPRDQLLRLVDIFRSMREPALVHCKSGADRSGLAAGIFLLAEGGSARDALAQLSPRYGHLPRSRAGVLRAVFLRYAAEAEGRKPFLAWLREDYDEAALRHAFASGKLASLLHDRLLARE
jgi:protein tyrosine/serine phosphatase